ncbi:MAG: hypothetical protein GY759_09270 [Chloroflexi bacterium]|nr:hypothetical protein [Chloroflexota bacterium]
MTFSKKKISFLVSTMAVAAFALVFTLATPQAASAHGGPGGFGRGSSGAKGSFGGPRQDTYLLEALDVTAEELQAAHEEASAAALAQAVDEGLLTQEQADAMQERGSRFGGFGKIGKFGRFGSSTIDREALLADALDITVDDLKAAREKAKDAALAKAVADGKITQEQVDQREAHQALRDYLSEQGLQDNMRLLYEDAVNEAVAAGVITQEQADQILSNQGRGFGMKGFGGRGFDGHGKRGSGPRGFGGRNITPPSNDSTTSTFFSF